MPAPYSYSTTVASGSTDIMSVPFPYLARADVHVAIDVVEVDDNTLTWTSDSTIQLPSTPTAGQVIKVYRDTPKDILAVNWSSPNVMAEADIERAFTQLLYVAQEAYDLGILPRIELDAIVNYVNTMANNAQASADAASNTKSAAESSVGAMVTAAEAAQHAAEDARDAAALIAEFDPSDFFQAANLLSEVSGDTDKATARGNIGAISAADVVTTSIRYDAAQSLDGTQKTTALSNIGAFPSVGGTVSGTLTASGKISASAGLDVTNGTLAIYGYSSDNNKGYIGFKSDSSVYMRYGVSGDYFEFNKHVYSSAGRLWGSNDFSLGSLGGATSLRWVSGGTRPGGTVGEGSPYVLTGLDESTLGGGGYITMYLRYLQYYINGTWYTVGFV